MVFGFGRQRPLSEQIFNAVRRNDFNSLQRLLANMPDHASPSVYAVMQDLELCGNREGQTALCLAAQQGQRDAVALLIRKGANINACSSRRDGGTPLHEATSSLQRPIVQMLMSAGASPFVENYHGDTAYDIAILRKAVLLVRDMEQLSHLGAYMQIKVTTFFGLSKDFKEFWGVVVPRLPKPGPPEPGTQRVRHTQVYLYLTYDSAVPTAKIWTDGAQMFASQQGQRQIFVMMLHQTHAPPASLAYTHDAHSGRMCLVFKASPRQGHGGAISTLLTIVNSNAAAHAPAAAPAAAAAAPAWPAAPAAPAARQSTAQPVAQPPPPSAPPPPAMPPPPDHVMAPPSTGGPAAVPAAAEAPAGLAAAAAAAAPASGDARDEEGELMMCVICMERPKAFGFLHGRGESLHACACKECAERWFREHATCPVCNQRADTIVPVFW